jgi:alanine racemase
MEKLEKVIRTIGILTNIGSSHDEGFVDLENKIKEKLILFKDVEILIYQRDLIDKLIFPKIKTFSWSEADVLFIKGDRGPRHCFIFQIQRNLL